MVSQRALQVHTDPMLGYTELDGVGYVVVRGLALRGRPRLGRHHRPRRHRSRSSGCSGRATAKIHCASDEDSDQDLVDFQVEEAIVGSLDGSREDLVAWVTDFGIGYADRVRGDHALFVDAFREGRIGIAAT